MAVYSVNSDAKYIYAQLSSRESLGRYDQYFFCVFSIASYPDSKEHYRLRFSTKQDLVNFGGIFWHNYYSLGNNEMQQESLFELLNKTINQWGDNRKLKTKRLLTDLYKNM